MLMYVTHQRNDHNVDIILLDEATEDK
jgi:hypothetical protein